METQENWEVLNFDVGNHDFRFCYTFLPKTKEVIAHGESLGGHYSFAVDDIDYDFYCVEADQAAPGRFITEMQEKFGPDVSVKIISFDAHRSVATPYVGW